MSKRNLLPSERHSPSLVLGGSWLLRSQTSDFPENGNLGHQSQSAQMRTFVNPSP